MCPWHSAKMFDIGDIVEFTPVQVHAGESSATDFGFIYDVAQVTGEYIILVRRLAGYADMRWYDSTKDLLRTVKCQCVSSDHILRRLCKAYS